MAFITEFSELSSGSTGRDHSTCSAGWRVTERAGERVLQIDTYGSPDRQDAGTVSQSIQLDHETARALVAIINRVFPGA
ncbi:MAG: hypothetical protein ACRDJ2_11340 [Actinomycetota bacterium]